MSKQPETNIDASSAPACPVGERQCRYLEEVARLRAEVDALGREVRTDALTGLYNFRYFSELLEQEVERSSRSGLPMALIMVDLDHFKRVNDTWGHELGNKALQLVAGILRSGVRRIDAVCRYGGEEMVLILPGTQLARAIKVAERMRIQVEKAGAVLDAHEVGLTASFGVGVYPSAGVGDGATLVEKTDELLYRAKEEGRNRVCHMTAIPEAPESQVTLDEKKALLDN